MKRSLCITIFAVVGMGVACAWADVVVMKDGSVRKGTVIGKNDDEVLLRIDREGIKATVGLMAGNVARIVTEKENETAAARPGEAAIAEAPGPEKAAAPEKKAEVSPGRAGLVVAELPPTRGFLVELGAQLLGHGPDDPRRLPDELKDLWDDAVRRDALGKRKEELESLRALDDAFMPLAGGMERLEAICRRERKEGFGAWMAQVHWDVLAEKYAGGRFDLSDVRAVERKALIGRFKEKTVAALEPLKGYFPPVDEKTGKAAAFKAGQLAGISLNNALQVKAEALYAMAVLVAQLKLEPEMAAADRALITGQLQEVGRILARATELEPAAKAAAKKK